MILPHLSSQLSTFNSQPFPVKRLRPTRHKPLAGLGDLVAIIAQPIARALDKTLGTDLKNCSGCCGRQQWLNKKLPFGKEEGKIGQ